MAKFLTTNGMSYQLEELIKQAKQQLYLFSPYLKLNERIRSLLEDRDRLKLDMRMIYGKNELQPEESENLRKLSTLRLTYSKNLHAKCYMSEDRAIIGSMNLYEFSQQNNEEMGILVLRSEEPELFAAIFEDAQRILRASEAVEITTIERVRPKKAESKSKKAINESPENDRDEDNTGFCIRCAASVPFDREKPYCSSDFRAWAKWENADYEDKFCHGCGAEIVATMNKPLCRSCYRNKKSALAGEDIPF